jgi:hypothetical protein
MPLPTYDQDGDDSPPDSPPALVSSEMEGPFPGFFFPVFIGSDNGPHFYDVASVYRSPAEIEEDHAQARASCLASRRQVFPNYEWYQHYWDNRRAAGMSVGRARSRIGGQEPTEVEEVD